MLDGDPSGNFDAAEGDGKRAVPAMPFLSLGSTRRPLARRWPILAVSAAAHVLAAAALLLFPLFLPDGMLERPEADYLRILIYDPPPPPPPPLPRGSPEGGRAVVRSRAAPEPLPTPVPSAGRLEAPVEVLAPEPTGITEERPGSPMGSESGVPEGMEEGVEGGVVGGLPGGVLGGVIGGTGTGPVPVRDYDRPPRLLRQRKPTYPSEAFVQKVQGVVLIELLIDSTGRVARARVIHSIPLLDAAALEAVYDWIFTPAIQRGRPVATIAMAPVSFAIY
jgi:periplasmic protein TonB